MQYFNFSLYSYPHNSENFTILKHIPEAYFENKSKVKKVPLSLQNELTRCQDRISSGIPAAFQNDTLGVTGSSLMSPKDEGGKFIPKGNCNLVVLGRKKVFENINCISSVMFVNGGI